MLLEKTKKIILRENLFQAGQKIVVAVSGGVDSVCLLDVLSKLKKDLKFDIVVAHLNHGLRGKEADKDQKFVERLAKKYKLPFFTTKITVLKEKKGGESIEQAARRIRYDFLEKVRQETKADLIATAHTADDQVETILLNLIRGTGLTGLSGMNYKHQNIIRPFLNIYKQELINYAKKNKLKYRKDITNEDISFSRNKIRHQIIPKLIEINPKFKEVLLRNAEIIKDDYQFIRKQVSSFPLSLSLKKWEKLSLVLKREYLRQAIEKTKGDLLGIDLKKIDKLIKFLDKGKTGKKFTLLKNLFVTIEYNKIVFFIPEKTLSKLRVQLNIPGQTNIESLKILISAKFVAKIGRTIKRNAFLDADKVGPLLFVRTRKKGDYFYPSSGPGRKKLQDFFVDLKIPFRERDKIPLIVNQKDEIVWVGGYRVDERFKATSQTKNILYLTLKCL